MIVALILIFAYPLSKGVVEQNGEILAQRREVKADVQQTEH